MTFSNYNFEFTSFDCSENTRIRNRPAIRIDKSMKRFYITKYTLKLMGFPESIEVGIDRENHAVIIVASKNGMYPISYKKKQTTIIYSKKLCEDIVSSLQVEKEYSTPIIGRFYKSKNAVVFSAKTDQVVEPTINQNTDGMYSYEELLPILRINNKHDLYAIVSAAKIKNVRIDGKSYFDNSALDKLKAIIGATEQSQPNQPVKNLMKL